MTRCTPRKTWKTVKAWAVFPSRGNLYFDSVRGSRSSAIAAYCFNRGYDWKLCVLEDGASVQPIRILSPKQPKKK